MILWTTRKAILSRIISKILGGPSHFSIFFENHNIVIHSILPAVDVEPEYSFLKRNKVLLGLKYTGEKTSEDAWELALKSYYKKPYDFGALLFGLIVMAFSGLRNVVKRNLWSSKKAFTCHELIKILEASGYLDDIDVPEDVDALTLMDLYDLILTSKYWVKCTV